MEGMNKFAQSQDGQKRMEIRRRLGSPLYSCAKQPQINYLAVPKKTLQMDVQARADNCIKEMNRVERRHLMSLLTLRFCDSVKNAKALS